MPVPPSKRTANAYGWPALLAAFALGYGCSRGGSRYPWQFYTHPQMVETGFDFWQLGSERETNFAGDEVPTYTMEEAELLGPERLYHATLMRSLPFLITDAAKEDAERVSQMTADDVALEWGHIRSRCTVYPGDWEGVSGGKVPAETLRRMGEPLVHTTMSDSNFVGNMSLCNLTRGEFGERMALLRSFSFKSFADFGLPPLPPGFGEVAQPAIRGHAMYITDERCAPAPRRAATCPRATPHVVARRPHATVMHYDWEDKMVVQLSGTKRYRLVDPAFGPSVAPAVLPIVNRVWDRQTGEFSLWANESKVDGQRNMALVDVAAPDLDRFPQFRGVKVWDVTVPEGAAFFMPAYWYHFVESWAPPGKLCIAAHYEMHTHSLATRFSRTLSANTYLNCSAPPNWDGSHPCAL
jgi:hypothetical protein